MNKKLEPQKPRGYDNWLINGTNNYHFNEQCIEYKKELEKLNKQ